MALSHFVMSARTSRQLRRARGPARATVTNFLRDSSDTNILRLRYRDPCHSNEQTSKLESPNNLEGTPALQSGTRKRNASFAGLDSSPASIESPEQYNNHHDSSARKKAVKRACNECRKLCLMTRRARRSQDVYSEQSLYNPFIRVKT